MKLPGLVSFDVLMSSASDSAMSLLPWPNELTWNAVISGYARRGDWDSAMAAFDGMKSEGLIPDLVTWNALVSGFVQSELAEEALKLFRYMLESGIRPNNVTVTGLIPACGSVISIRRGREIHGLIYRMGLQMNVYVASALVDMYSKCGSVKVASNAFQAVTVKSIASWNAMMGCFGKHNMVESALHLFEKMKQEGIAPNEVAFVSVLSACSHSGLVDKGLKIFRSMKEDDDVLVLKEHNALHGRSSVSCGKDGRSISQPFQNHPINQTNSLLEAPCTNKFTYRCSPRRNASFRHSVEHLTRVVEFPALPHASTSTFPAGTSPTNPSLHNTA